MKKLISLVLIQALFLIGCGSSNPSGSQYKAPETKSKTDIKADKDGKIKTIKLSGSADSVAVSKDALFVAKGKDGVDVVKIGYDDAISSEFITAIEGINAKSVNLSKDGSKLYVENEQGFVNIINIQNLSNPIKESVTTKQKTQKFVQSGDGYKFVPKGEKGLEIYDASNPSNIELKLTFNKANVYDIVLADKESKALLASGAAGINLLDITTPTSPNMIANFSVGGGVKGLSLNQEQGILFVANGDNGVLVYNLNIMLDMIVNGR